MSIASIKNYMQVSDRIATSGQPKVHHFNCIANAAYKVVINLSMPDSEGAIPNEGNIVTGHEMAYIHLPVPFDNPSKEHLRQFFRIMNSFADQKTWVHCAANFRASAFLYQYKRLVLCESVNEANKVILSTWIPNATWLNLMNYTYQDLYA